MDPDPTFMRFQEKLGEHRGHAQLLEQLSNYLIEVTGYADSVFVLPARRNKRRATVQELLTMCSSLRGRRAVSGWLVSIAKNFPFSELPRLVVDGWDWRDTKCDLYLILQELTRFAMDFLIQQEEARLWKVCRT